MNYKKYLPILILVLVSLIPLLDLLRPGLPTTHDGQDHVARIANFYQNLSDGNFIPRWAANLNWGFGHPILMFLYPLPSYFASLFHFFGFSLVDATKLVFALSFTVSGVAMYLWVRNFLGEKAGFLAALLYLFAPYRFVDLYVRGAIGEHVAFVFPPLILYFLLKLSKSYSFWYIFFGSISFAGLILSHNAVSLMFLPLTVLYMLFLLYSAKSRRILIYQYIGILVFGFGLSFFFWFPAFFEGKYTLRDIVTSREFTSRFVTFSDFIYSRWEYGISGRFSTQVGFVHWFVTLASVALLFLLNKKKDSIWILIAGAFFIFWITLFLMTAQSEFIWNSSTLLQKFQFPWRFLSVTVFITALLGGFFIFLVPKNTKLPLVVSGFALLLFLHKDYWQAKAYLDKPETFFTSVYNSTTDTGESSPIWSVRFMEHRPKVSIEVISGKADIRQIERLSTKHVYKIEASEKTRIVENTLYFPGWNVFVDNQAVPLEFQDPQYRGLMTFYVEKGNHTISLLFKETKIRLLANSISMTSMLFILFYIVIQYKKKQLLKKV